MLVLVLVCCCEGTTTTMLVSVEGAASKAVARNDTHVTTFVVLGASGHLAKTKTFPALFQVFLNDLLPSRFTIYGYARSALTQRDFHDQLRPFLKGPPERVSGFLNLCYYHEGQYDDKASFAVLHDVLSRHEAGVLLCARVLLLLTFALYSRATAFFTWPCRPRFS